MASPRKQAPVNPADLVSDIVPPLDYSFLSLQNVTEIVDEEPRIWNPKKSKLKRLDNGKYDTKCLRLNNNTLTDISALMDVVQQMFDRPEDVAWIDLSFNELTKIDPIITHFKNLQILYLHSNQISDMKEIEKLAALTNLKKISLHANPIDAQPGYRKIVLAHMPKLQFIDFSMVTKGERATALAWFKMNANKKPKKKRIDDD